MSIRHVNGGMLISFMLSRAVNMYHFGFRG